MDWFSGWHWAIVAVVFLVLFGSSRLPGAARALGSSMNIFKRSLKDGMNEDGKPASVTQATVFPAAPLTSPPPPDPGQQAQIEELQRQIQDMQRAAAGGDSKPAGGAASAEPSRDAGSPGGSSPHASTAQS